mmetsp:Transcript_43036/g.106190  ORF Transcript_43036/g.106190 Transcript_43036/m.106190 type:complete len:209 (-) Transcript_43036:418-1044(-)
MIPVEYAGRTRQLPAGSARPMARTYLSRGRESSLSVNVGGSALSSIAGTRLRTRGHHSRTHPCMRSMAGQDISGSASQPGQWRPHRALPMCPSRLGASSAPRERTAAWTLGASWESRDLARRAWTSPQRAAAPTRRAQRQGPSRARRSRNSFRARGRLAVRRSRVLRRRARRPRSSPRPSGAPARPRGRAAPTRGSRGRRGPCRCAVA